MRQNIKALFLGVTLLGATSCGNDWLDLKPSTELPTGDAIQNYKDLTTALNGVYDGLQEDPNYYGAQMLYYGDVRGEDMQSTSTAARSANLYMFNYTLDNAPQIWEAPYDVIRRANNVILAIEQGKVTDGNTEDIADVKGQALAARALAHFDLVRIYGLPYTLNEGSSYGIPVVLEPKAPSFTAGRNSVAEVYAQVEADLTDAIALLKTKPMVGYFNQWAAKGILSRVYLYKGENDKALSLAKDIIENSPYALWKTDEYVKAWSQQGTSEHMFEIVNYSTSDWVDREAIGYLMSENGYGAVVLTNNYLDLLYQDEKDVRIGVTLLSKKDDVPGSKKTLYLNKFPGRGGNPDVRVNNIPVLRLSEIYLIAAEAAVKSGDASADEYLNAIVLRANPEATPITGATLENVLTERRKELVGEGHRFFDAMRNGLTITRYTEFSASTSGWHLSLTDQARSFDVNYTHALLPIPKKECDVNPIIRAQQNPGY